MLQCLATTEGLQGTDGCDLLIIILLFLVLFRLSVGQELESTLRGQRLTEFISINLSVVFLQVNKITLHYYYYFVNHHRTRSLNIHLLANQIQFRPLLIPWYVIIEY